MAKVSTFYIKLGKTDIIYIAELCYNMIYYYFFQEELTLVYHRLIFHVVDQMSIKARN